MTTLSLTRPTPTTTPKPRRRVLRLAAWTGGLIALAATAFVAALSPIDPIAWSPHPAPALTGVLAPNEELAKAELVTATPDGPEDITFDAQGRLYTGDESSPTTSRASPTTSPPRPTAPTGWASTNPATPPWTACSPTRSSKPNSPSCPTPS